MNVIVKPGLKPGWERGYDHARLERRRWIMRWFLMNIGFRLLAKIDRVEGLEHFPKEGSAIVMINHIGFIDGLAVIGSLPRNVVPIGKIEAYSYPVVGIFPRLWHIIPVQRRRNDIRAIRMAFEVLKAGEVVLVAPEGTRNISIRGAKGGVAYLSYYSRAPVIPIAIWGTEGFPTLNPRRMLQPGAVIQLGRPFQFRRVSGRLGRETLRQMTDEAMYILAKMLPGRLRGDYTDTDQASLETIEFV